MHEEDVEIQEHWSYTIMGNWLAGRLHFGLISTAMEGSTPKEREQFKHKPVYISIKYYINKYHNNILRFVEEANSRLAYLVYGILIMECGANMSDDLRELLLLYSDWSQEKEQLENEEFAWVREEFLAEYQEQVKSYENGMNTRVTTESIEDSSNK